MKRAIAMILVLLLAPAALAERIVYADQGGVRVFEEDGRVGLLDSDGSALLPAAYDGIAPFDGDYAVVTLDGRQGVIRRDGSWALECAQEAVYLYPGFGLAETVDDVYEANPRCRLVDLETGETLMDGGGNATFYADDRFVYRLEYGYRDPWELVGPFVLTICDGELSPLLTIDGAETADFLGWGFAAWITTSLWAGGGEWRFVDPEGNVLLDHVMEYTADGENACYVREVENPVRRTLESAGYSRARLKRALKRRLGVDDDAAHLLTRFMEDYTVCGILRPDGARVETRGCEIDPCENGLYRVNARSVNKYGLVRTLPLPDGSRSRELYEWLAGYGDRWGYIDAGGAWVLPPVYDRAYNFVDGAAVVQQGGVHFLIDAEGRRVGNAEWTSDMPWTKYGWNHYPGFAVVVDGGSRMVDRRGEYLSDEVFVECESAVRHGNTIDGMGGYPPVLTDAEGRYCVFDENGSVAVRMFAENWDRRSAPEGAIWLKVGGKWGLMDLREGTAGQWRAEPAYDVIYDRALYGCCWAGVLTDRDVKTYAERWLSLFLNDDGQPVAVKPAAGN